MTIIYGQEFMQGTILIADSRASKRTASGMYDPWRDNTQKIFRLGGHIFISFCGDIDFAGSIIGFLIKQIQTRPRLENIHIFRDKCPKLIKFAYKQLSTQTGRNPDVGFIVAGIDHGRPELVRDKGKVVSILGNIFDKKTFKLSSPNFEVIEARFFTKPILVLGSGEPLINELEEDFKNLYNFGGFMKRALDYRALIIGHGIKEKAEKTGETSVGGLFQIVVIDDEGSRFIPYKTRSTGNTEPELLDLEMAMQDGRWIQRDLKDGKEIILLYPPEVIKISDDSPELFALLNSNPTASIN